MANRNKSTRLVQRGADKQVRGPGQRENRTSALPVLPRARRSQIPALVAAALLLATALMVYVWILSAGLETRWPTYTDYSSKLSDAFMNGQTSLVVQPPPALLALPDPFDPHQNRGLRLHDASIYNGKYYLYWGPVPALMLSIVRLPLRFLLPDSIGDQYLALAFLLGTVASLLLLGHLAMRRFYSEAPAWTLIVGTVAVALCPPVVFLLGRAAVYEVAILSGQCFTWAGLYCAARGADQRVRVGWLAAAGLAWALAAGSRISLVLGLIVLVALTLFRVVRFTQSRRSERVTAAFALLLPLGMAGVALAAYNEVRFGSPLESGTRYQLADINGFGTPPANLFVSTRYIVPNLYRYLLEPMESRGFFPFVRGGMSSVDWARDTFKLPRHYLAEPVAGLVWCMPFGLFSPIPLITLAWRGRPAKQTRAADAGHNRSLQFWLTACIAGFGLFAAVPLVCFFASTTRYLADVAPAITLLAVFGMCQATRLLPRLAPVRWMLPGLTGALVLYGGLTAICLGAYGAAGHFPRYNPDLYHWLGYHLYTDPPPPEWQDEDESLPASDTSVGHAGGDVRSVTCVLRCGIGPYLHESGAV